MANYPFYENIDLNIVFPVRIQKHYNDSTGIGCEFHWHEAIEIYYVKSGGLKLNSRGNMARINAGDIGLVGWGHPHRGCDYNYFSRVFKKIMKKSPSEYSKQMDL